MDTMDLAKINTWPSVDPVLDEMTEQDYVTLRLELKSKAECQLVKFFNVMDECTELFKNMKLNHNNDNDAKEFSNFLDVLDNMYKVNRWMLNKATTFE